MYSQSWQVGLDIQMEAIRALAVVRRRYGWQLRYWWHQSLPSGVLREGILHQPDIVSEQLKLLHKQLPKNISLRIALPTQRILQHTIPTPDKRLREPARGGFINATASRVFPANNQALSLDYRTASASGSEIIITAARQTEVQQWQACLNQAGLPAHVIDITPCALRYMAAAAGLSGNYWLVHRLVDEWLWVSSSDMPFDYGVIVPDGDSDGPHGQRTNTTDPLAQLYIRLASAHDSPVRVYYSSLFEEPLPDNMMAWSPFAAFAQYQPPLPPLPAAFTLAGGLALRPADY
ncbi:type IV pilus biogenesis protein PilM [Yersinia aldovae]|uniref:Pilus assembly protein HofM n=1 Tax=Yersinia aldovae TaxID=29483 RepID=A0A0T9T2V8_YERAL|nr:pilus assembly protein PilM [Yersinia aldovae]AJJ64485.1 putative ATPases of the HSP70 class involved in cell division [Yersinia aldovae 670-83]EEP95550.1 hypothetical protein yaldo0001_31220 [Yersinia aldovae ATCC 35236]CNJ63836.1 pilus assembly protein HofM [Yersinia aldovae]CNK56303.1 pilus assembly protein HofM [Yersinia aldovae]CNK56389.1 pilus assembly protein HofM [Yersinia aldovae]